MISANWFIIALLTAFFAASQDAWVKRYFSNFSAFEMMAFPMAYSLPLFCIVYPFITVPPIDHVFWIAFWVSIPVNGLGFLLHIRAIQTSALSLTLPYLAFTPVFIFFTGFLILNESPNVWGVVGVSIIVVGSYILNIDPDKYSLLSPLRAFGRERGSVIMLLASFVYSFSAVIGKKAIIHSSVMFFSVLFFLCLNACFLIFAVIFKKVRFSRLLKMPVKGSVAGGLLFAHILCHGWAISLTKAVYMISVKRISILFGTIYGGLLFSESHMTYRVIGTIFMIAGAVLVSVKGL